jgi:phosphatidate cytidylyltransferase
MNVSSHAKRWLTSLVLLPVLACLVVCGGWFLFAGVLVIALLGLYEFYELLWPGCGFFGRKAFGLALGAGFLFAAQLGWTALAGGLLIVAFWAANLVFLCSFSRSQGQARYPEHLILVSGLLYIPFMLHFFLGFRPQETVLVLLATFASDTGAYYAGTWWGKRKIWPSISPKKTWAGALGGAATCVVICLVLGLSIGDWPFGRASFGAWLLLGVTLNLASQCGDFFESALKRSLDAKDSGALLPGHGGVLDRIDSLLLVTPVYKGASLLLASF